jgi:hypothetical protein
MLWQNLYVDAELRRMEREKGAREIDFRAEWYAGQPAVRPLRSAVRWMGDRLVGAGERLRNWGAVGAGVGNRQSGVAG